MTEERWHNFAKEKPSEDMEGRNFIVSNGHYEKIATWCGYWENEPFMGDHLCDEVVRWKFYFTLEEEKANDATHTELKPMKCDELKDYRITTRSDNVCHCYLKSDVDAAIAELKARIQLDDDEMAGFLQLEEECGGGDLRNYIAELKRKLDDAKATAYTESVDAGMRERRLKRALWLARAMRAEAQWNRQLRDAGIAFAIGENKSWDSWNQKQKKWQVVERKCRAKAEEYKWTNVLKNSNSTGNFEK